MAMLETFQKFMGTGILLIWYLAAIVFLLLKEKRKPVRVMFVYVPVILLVVFLNPLFALLFEKALGMEIYFRNIWLLPMTVTLAYSVVLGCLEFSGKRRILFASVTVVLVMVSGNLVYTNPLFSKAENVHHVPQEVVEICDMIQVEGREVKAVFPAEFLLYVRQYSPVVCMPYGRDAVQGYFKELYALMNREEIDVEKMAELSKRDLCHYVIFSKEKTLLGNPADYDYELFGQVGNYLIYKDTTMNFSITGE